MISRVSSQTMYNSALSMMAQNQNKLYDLQTQALTGYKVNSITDNPVDAAKILGLNTSIGKMESYQTNVGTAQGEYDVMDSTLAQVVEKLQRINELANSAANEFNTENSLQAIKSEVTMIKESLVDLANTNYSGKYIFSGTNTGTPTFSLEDDGSIVYSGTPASGDYKRRVEVTDGVYLTLNVTGDSVFGNYNAADGSGQGIFKTISDLEAALEKAGSTDATISQEGFDEIRAAIDTNSTNLDKVTGIRAEYGTYAQKADMTETSLSDNMVLLQSDRSDLQEVDLYEAYSNLAYQQYVLEASMQINAMTLQQSSLLNYL